MTPKELAKIVKEYREKTGLSQGELANKLAFTQATISRIESAKQLPRASQLEKLLQLMGTPMRPPAKSDPTTDNLIFQENYSQFLKGEWNCFWVNRQFGQVGGDVVLVKELEKNQQIGVLIGDSVGHGHTSAYMSFALEFAYSTIASMMSSALLSPSFFERALGMGIAKTGSSWRGEPSIELIQLDLRTSTLSMINRGMPYPILLESDKASHLTTHRAPAFSLEERTVSGGTLRQSLEPGQSVLFYTDGLLDLVQESELTVTMQRLNRLFRGDARALGRNLIRSFQKNPQTKKVTDDVSFLIVSRTRKAKSGVVTP